MSLKREGPPEDLVYSTKRDLVAALDKVEQQMNLPTVGNVKGVPAPQNQQTVRWHDRDDIKADESDGKFRMRKPADEFLTDVTGKTEVRTIRE